MKENYVKITFYHVATPVLYKSLLIGVMSTILNCHKVNQKEWCLVTKMLTLNNKFHTCNFARLNVCSASDQLMSSLLWKPGHTTHKPNSIRLMPKLFDWQFFFRFHFCIEKFNLGNMNKNLLKIISYDPRKWPRKEQMICG